MDTNYELIDCGNERRLERFGEILCDRPAPMALGNRRAEKSVWAGADLRFDAARREWAGNPPGGEWFFRGRVADGAEVRMRLTPGKNGQIGVFPEQIANWEWLYATITAARRERENSAADATAVRVRVLNTFAHTGGSTLFCAAAGAEVCHLDAAAAAVTQARENAALSGFADRPVRWIVDDVKKFLRREIRRNSRYDGIILDPPAFGRSGKTIWRLEDDLPELLELAAQVLTPNLLFVLLTCHPTGWRPADLDALTARYFPCFSAARTEEIIIKGELNSLPLGLCWRGIVNGKCNVLC